MHEQPTQTKEKSFSNINKRSFFVVVGILTGILLFCGALSYFIPQGSFLRDAETGAIIDGTYVQGAVQGIALWRIPTAPFRVFASEDALTIIFISLFF